MKQLVADPWENIAGKYPEGTRLTGKVTNLVDYGAFVELEPGVEGLVHISEMSWTRKLRHPSQMVHVGDEVEVVVLSVDPEKKRISLGMRALESMENFLAILATESPFCTLYSKGLGGSILRMGAGPSAG